MYVCICKGITDTALRKAVEAGAGSWHEVRNQLGVATQCGQCACLGKSLVNEFLSVRHPMPEAMFYPA